MPIVRFCRLKGIGLDVIQAPKAGPRIMRYELMDFEWAAIRSFLPNKPCGIPRVDDRRVLNGIFWVLRSGAPWRDLPETYGPHTTCYNRFVRWRQAGIWDRIMDALAAGHDAAVQMIDTSVGYAGCAPRSALPNRIRFISRRSAVDAVTRPPPSGIRSGHCRIAARIRHFKKLLRMRFGRCSFKKLGLTMAAKDRRTGGNP